LALPGIPPAMTTCYRCYSRSQGWPCRARCKGLRELLPLREDLP
jgi:hypothetical protein